MALSGDPGSGWGACSPTGPCYLAMDQGDDFDAVRVEPTGIVVSPAVCEAKKKVVISRQCPVNPKWQWGFPMRAIAVAPMAVGAALPPSECDDPNPVVLT